MIAIAASGRNPNMLHADAQSGLPLNGDMCQGAQRPGMGQPAVASLRASRKSYQANRGCGEEEVMTTVVSEVSFALKAAGVDNVHGFTATAGIRIEETNGETSPSLRLDRYPPATSIATLSAGANIRRDPLRRHEIESSRQMYPRRP
jgi:hypothetical protein